MFGRRKSSAMITGGFLTANSNRTKEIELIEKKKKVKELQDDIEYHCNTAMYFFYLAYVYTGDIYKKHINLSQRKKSLSQHEEYVLRNLQRAYEIMNEAYDNFLSYCNNEQDKEYVKRLMEHATFLASEYTENQVSSIFYAIKKYYMSETDSETSKAFANTEAIATTIATRRLFVMAHHTSRNAISKYGCQYPNMNCILQREKLSIAFKLINDVYTKITLKIKDIDLSKDSLCSKSQERIIKEITNRLFHKAVAKSLELNSLS